MRGNGPKACNADVPAASNEQGCHGGRAPSGKGVESEPADERAIIARCLAGERTAYAILVERYKGLVHDLVCRMIGDAMEADDIAQEAFVKAYVSLKHFRGESRFSTWLCRIALNRCKDLLRRRGREPRIRTAQNEELHIADAVDKGDAPGVALERREWEGRLDRALARLPMKYREVVVLRHIEELDFRELGRLLKIPEGTAKVRAFRAREMLRTLIEDEGTRR
jgi:RNA polymerase sigma-70 factor (ECF subfamily)